MKTAFVTGANRGLGKGFVEVLLKQGYRVLAGMRRPAEFSLQSELVTPIEIDLGSDLSCKRAVEVISSTTESLELLINCGAIQRNSPELGSPESVCKLENLSNSALLKMFEVNAVQPILLLQGLLPLLTSDPSYCINISSARGSLYTDETPHSSGNYGYRASKAALSMLTMASTFDLPKNVRTFSVHPGLVATDMNPKGNISPIQSAELILKITEHWSPELHGAFLRNDGSIWPL